MSDLRLTLVLTPYMVWFVLYFYLIHATASGVLLGFCCLRVRCITVLFNFAFLVAEILKITSQVGNTKNQHLQYNAS